MGLGPENSTFWVTCYLEIMFPTFQTLDPPLKQILDSVDDDGSVLVHVCLLPLGGGGGVADCSIRTAAREFHIVGWE